MNLSNVLVRLVTLGYAGVLLLEVPLYAHHIEVDYLREGDTVKVEVFYPGSGSPAEGAHIRVSDSSGQVVAEGKTDGDGAYTFTTLAPGPFTVVALHDGHHAQKVIDAPGSGSRIEGSRIRREPPPGLTIVAGLGFIFGVAGFVLALLAWRRSTSLAEQLEKKERGGERAL